MKKIFSFGKVQFVLIISVLLSNFNVYSENISLDFNNDVLDSPPQGVFSSGTISKDSYVRVEQDGFRSNGDLSVVFKWSKEGKAPRMVISSEKTPFPSQGALLFDFIVKKHGGPFHIVGKSNKDRTLFHVLVNKKGQAAVRTPQGDTVINDYNIGQWYLERLTYNFEKGLYSIILDNYSPSGEVKTLTLEKGEFFKEILFYGEEGGPSLYALDSICLVATDNKKKSTIQKSDLPIGAYKRKIHWNTVLVPEDKYKRAVIVYPSGMKNGSKQAMKLRDFIKEKTGKTMACLSDRVVTHADSWLVRNKYINTPMIVLGNAVDNKVIYAIATKFLAMSNHRWPGKDKFCNRSILEPFMRDTNLILLEASTPEGMAASVDSFCKRLGAIENKELSVPYFRQLGRAKGVWKEKPYKSKGLDLSKSLDDIKEQIIKKYGKNAPIRGGALYFYPIWQWLSGGSIEAAKFAAAVLLLRQDRLGGETLGGHYNYDRAFKGWQLCFTSGVLDEDTINRIELIMAKNAADPRDYYAYGFRYHNGKRISRKASRHTHSSLSNYLCCPDYVLTHCRLNSITKKMVEAYDKAYRDVGRRFTDSFRDNNVSSSLPDSSVAIINLMALTGDLDFVCNGTLADTAASTLSMINNLGYYPGQSSYIGSRSLRSGIPVKSILSTAAFYYRDPEYQWLAKHLKGGVCRSSHENPVFKDSMPEKYPEKYLGVTTVPFDKRIYRALETPDYLPHYSLQCSQSGIPYEELFDCAVFRDGFKPDEAFLLLMSTQLIGSNNLNHSNAITQYTDLGKVLLYSTSQLLEKWARNIVTASNGLPSKATFACKQKALINSGDVSAISSVNPYSGNSEWTRNIIHKRGHFFVVIDKMKALSDDDYAFTCKWRTYYPQTLDQNGVCDVDAGDGVKMKIIGANNNIEHDSHQAKADGITKPYMYIQRKNKNLKKGQVVGFKNMFYASSPERPDNCDIKEVDANSVIVKGNGKDWAETALIGVDKSPALLKNLEVDADIFYITKDKVVAANCRKIQFAGKSLFSSVDGENTTVSLEGKQLDLESVFENLARPVISESKKTPDHGIKELWTFSDFIYPDVRLDIENITSNKKASRNDIKHLNDDLVKLIVMRKGSATFWPKGDAPLEITLDMGKVVDISDIRIPTVVEDSYVRKNYYKPGEMKFKVVCSNDNFKNDIRKASPEVRDEFYTYPRAHYAYAGRIPIFVIPVNSSARYVKIIPETDNEVIAFQKIIVNGKQKNKNLNCKVKRVDLDGNGKNELLVLTSNSEVLLLSAKGEKVWNKQFPGTITAWNVVDLENDGKKEILIYTTEDKLYTLKHDGGRRQMNDINEFSKTQKDVKWGQWDRWYCTHCFKHVDAWDPDGDGLKEIVGFGHTTKIIIEPDNSIRVDKTGGYQPETSLANSTVLGKKVFVGMSHYLKIFDKNYKSFRSIRLPSKYSGNNELKGLTKIMALDKPGLKGFLVLNPLSLLWIKAKGLKEGWSEYSKVPITCAELVDFNNDGHKDLITGYKDGFIRIYDIKTGKVINKFLTGTHPVLGIGLLDDGKIAVISPKGLSVCDKKLNRVGFYNIQADAIATLSSNGKDEIIISDDKGVIHSFETTRGNQ